MNIVYWQEGDEYIHTHDSFVPPIAVHENYLSDPFASYGNYGAEIPYAAFRELLKGKTLSFSVNDEYCFSVRISPDDLKKCLSEVIE